LSCNDIAASLELTLRQMSGRTPSLLSDATIRFGVISMQSTQHRWNVSEIAVAIFPDETKAQAAAEALAGPLPSHEIVVRGAALLVKNADGTVSQRKWTSRIPWKAPSGAIVGALIGFLGGPIGAAIGFASGGLIGFSRDASDTVRREEFLRTVHTQLSPGRSALVVELGEHSVQPFNTHVQRLGGTLCGPARAA